jgi:hypothetical protein
MDELFTKRNECPMKDLTDPRWIKLKGLLFLFSGIASSALLILRDPNWKPIALLAISIWCFCRFYYFAFYVIEKYVDSSYRFSGLWSFFSYLARNRRVPPPSRASTDPKR